MIIKILGSGCNNCVRLEANARKAAEELGLTAEFVKVKEMAEGDVLKVIATDPSTTRDVPKFCQFLGFPLLEQKEEGDLFLYYIQKSA